MNSFKLRVFTNSQAFNSQFNTLTLKDMNDFNVHSKVLLLPQILPVFVYIAAGVYQVNMNARCAGSVIVVSAIVKNELTVFTFLQVVPH